MSYGDPFNSYPGPTLGPAPGAEKGGKKPDAFFSVIRGIFDRKFGALEGRIEGVKAEREARQERMTSLLEAAYETVKEAQKSKLKRGWKVTAKESAVKVDETDLEGLTQQIKILSASVTTWTRKIQRQTFFEPHVLAQNFRNLHCSLDELAFKNLESLKINRRLKIIRETKSFGFRGESLEKDTRSESESDSDSDSKSDSESVASEPKIAMTPCKTVRKRRARRGSAHPATDRTAKK